MIEIAKPKSVQTHMASPGQRSPNRAHLCLLAGRTPAVGRVPPISDPRYPGSAAPACPLNGPGVPIGILFLCQTRVQWQKRERDRCRAVWTSGLRILWAPGANRLLGVTCRGPTWVPANVSRRFSWKKLGGFGSDFWAPAVLHMAE